MKHATLQVLALTMSLAAAGGAVAQQEPAGDAMTTAEVRASLESQGYTSVNDVEFEDGVWKADARSADGQRVDLRIDPATGKVYPEDAVAQLGEADVRARLSAAGYANVHDVEFDDGMWTADAEDADGRALELTMDPDTGKVVGKDRD